MDKNDEQWEKLLRISTCGRDDSKSDTYRYPYEPTPYPVLERLGNSGLIGKKNKLADYGCGKGRVSIYMSFQTGCKSVGIDYDERMIERAVNNQKKGGWDNKTEFILVNAEKYMPDEECDRFYFFNPFSVEILRGVIMNIVQAGYENPKKRLLFFYYPSDEYISFLMTVDELEFYDEIECMDLFDNNDSRERILIFSTI